MLTAQETCDWFVQGEVESVVDDWRQELPASFRLTDVEADADTVAWWTRYCADVAVTLELLLAHYPALFQPGTTVAALLQDDAPLDLFLTITGAGAGIADGRWDRLVQTTNQEGETMDYFPFLIQLLKARLRLWADDTGGGLLVDRFRDNAEAWVQQNGYAQKAPREPRSEHG
jgi:hypothetical protein